VLLGGAQSQPLRIGPGESPDQMAAEPELVEHLRHGRVARCMREVAVGAAARLLKLRKASPRRRDNEATGQPAKSLDIILLETRRRQVECRRLQDLPYLLHLERLVRCVPPNLGATGSSGHGKEFLGEHTKRTSAEIPPPTDASSDSRPHEALARMALPVEGARSSRTPRGVVFCPPSVTMLSILLVKIQQGVFVCQHVVTRVW
jgi:hypothetical protein